MRGACAKVFSSAEAVAESMFDDLAVTWPLRGLCGTCGAIAGGICVMKALGGAGDVSFVAHGVAKPAGPTGLKGDTP